MILEFNLEPGTRLDTGVCREFPQYFSRAHAQRIIKEGSVTVNGVPCLKPSHNSELVGHVAIQYEPPGEYILIANNKQSIPVIYQDRFLAVIHKPAGMTVHPGAGTKDDTLVHVLLSQMDKLSEGSDKLRPGIVHRLDRETEGLMVIAKDNHTHFELAREFSERHVIKEYHAWVWGHTEQHLEIEGYIGRHPTQRKKMLFDYIPLNQTYKPASMSYEKLLETPFFTLLKIRLFTGRTHQIRATLSKLEYPVVGDLIYSRFERRVEKAALSRTLKEAVINGGLFLVASRLSFTHPDSKKNLDFQLSIPERFNMLKVEAL